MSLYAQFLVNALVEALQFSAFSAGFFLLWRANGFLDLSYTAAILVSAYTATVLSFPPWVVFSTSIFVAVVTLLLVRKITLINQEKGTNEHGKTLAGFGISVSFSACALLFLGPTLQTSAPINYIEPVVVAYGATIVPSKLLMAGWALIILNIIFFLFYGFGKISIIFQAYQCDRNAAYMVGLPVQKIETALVVLSGITVGGCSAILAWDVGVTPEFGMLRGVEVLLAVFIVGGRNVIFAAVGGGLFGFLKESIVIFIPATWKDPATLLVLIIVAMTVSGVSVWNTRRLSGASL